MPVPNSPTWNDIYHEPNPPGSNPVGLALSSFTSAYNYFQGPSGSNVVQYSSWGQGDVNGDDIYAVRSLSGTPIKFSTYRDQYYFYDQSNYQSQWTVDNQCPPQPWYNFNWNLTWYDSSLTYQYGFSQGGLSNGGTNTPLGDVSQPTSPLIYGVHWILQVDANDPMYPNDARVDLNIAQTNLMVSVAIVPGTNIYDSTTYGVAYMSSMGGWIGTDTVITFHL